MTTSPATRSGGGTRRAQLLDRVLRAYRIGDPDGEYPLFDATGSRLYPGRWNTPLSPMIYCSAHYSTAMLEKLAHGNGALPPNQHYIEVTIPPAVTYEVLDQHSLPGWADADPSTAQAFGEKWHLERRSVLLIVPSVVARIEDNYLLNPAHPEFTRITHSLHKPVWWDARLFS